MTSAVTGLNKNEFASDLQGARVARGQERINEVESTAHEARAAGAMRAQPPQAVAAHHERRRKESVKNSWRLGDGRHALGLRPLGAAPVVPDVRARALAGQRSGAGGLAPPSERRRIH